MPYSGPATTSLILAVPQMRTGLPALVLLMLSIACIAAPAQKVLLVAGSGSNYVAQGLAQLAIEHQRVPRLRPDQPSLFDYDLVIWGFDEARGDLSADPDYLAAFIDQGGVLLGFRRNATDPWLPSPVKRDKAYHFGKILTPEHPIFNTPHTLTDAEVSQVHTGSIYDAFYELGEGWVPLVSASRQQEWDKRQARHQGPHYGIIELPYGKGRIVLSQMIPEYHWFKDSGGRSDVEGARLFENLVRYAISRAPALAASRPPRVLPGAFHAQLAEVIALPKRGSGLPMNQGWQFSSNGPYTIKTDRRGVLTLTHADAPSEAGNFAQVTRTETVPPDADCVTLRWYESDTYCGGRERVLGGEKHGQTALENYKKDMRYAQVMVNGEVVWEQDVLGRNPQPAGTRVRTADITALAQKAGGKCEITLRVEDRQASGEQPFAIDVFWATVQVITDMLRLPAAEAFEATGFQPQQDGSLTLPAGRGDLTYTHRGPAGPYLLALQLRDCVDGRSTVDLLADGDPIGQWRLTADDHRLYWAVSRPVQLHKAAHVQLQAVAQGGEPVAIRQLAVVPLRMATQAAKGRPPRPPTPEPVPHARFTVTCTETAGVPRRAEIVAQGLPLPYGCLRDTAALRVTDKGKAVPCQMRPIAHWPDGSVKVALVCFPVSVPANAAASYDVEVGQDVLETAAPTQVTVSVGSDAITIRTGALTATVSTTRGTLVEQVSRGPHTVKPVDEVWDLAIEDDSGRILRTAQASVSETTVVDRGPLRALVVRKGAFTDADGTLIDFQLQLEATAGSDALNLDSIIINREDGAEVYLKRWSMDLQHNGPEQGRVWLDADRSQHANAGAVLYQHTEKVLTWTGEEGPVSREQLRAPGYTRLPGVAVGMRWFWQRFPQAIRFSDDGVRFDFIPQALDEADLPTRWRDRMAEMTDRYTVGGVGYPQSPGKIGLFRLARGEALSQQTRFVFDGRETSAPVDQAFAPLVAKLRAVPDPPYTADTRAFGVFHPRDPLRYPRYEASVDRLHDSYIAKREGRREYGFENFGDDTFEWGYGPSYTYWSGSEYDHHHGFAIQYLRARDTRWWELAEQQARMFRDVVVIHHAPEGSGLVGGPRHHNATSVWMPSHEDQCWVADHTCSGPSAGHSWAEGLIDYWYLTGDPWTEEVVHQMADWYCGIAENNRFGAGGQERGPGWALIAISALAAALNEQPIIQAGWTVADWILNWQDPIRGVVSVPISEQPSYEGGSTFMHGIVGRGLGRWYDYTADPRLRDAAIGIAEWITTEPMGEPGRFWYKQSPNNSRSYGATSQCLTALSYAYQLTGDSWFEHVAMALLSQTSAGSRSMSWYPQSLSHLAPALAIARASIAPRRIAIAPGASDGVTLSIRNTSAGPLTANISASAPEGISVQASPTVSISKGDAIHVPVKIAVTGRRRSATLTIYVDLAGPAGVTARREAILRVDVVEGLVRIDAGADRARLTLPMVLDASEPTPYAHTPRDESFLPQPRPQDGKAGGYATWTLEVPTKGRYTLWAQVYWLDAEGNSLFASIGSGEEAVFGNSGDMMEWIWVKGATVPLEAGPHTVRIRTREDGARVRTVRLTNRPTE